MSDAKTHTLAASVFCVVIPGRHRVSLGGTLYDADQHVWHLVLCDTLLESHQLLQLPKSLLVRLIWLNCIHLPLVDKVFVEVKVPLSAPLFQAIINLRRAEHKSVISDPRTWAGLVESAF